MPAPDDFSSYIGELLRGSYDCVDRIVLRAYYPMGQTSGGFLLWWNDLNPNTALSQEHLRRMAGDFSRRVRAFGQKHQIPIQYWPDSVAPSAAARPKLSIPSTFITKLSNVKCSPPCNI